LIVSGPTHRLRRPVHLVGCADEVIFTRALLFGTPAALPAASVAFGQLAELCEAEDDDTVRTPSAANARMRGHGELVGG
jgi:hypothetical protein